MTVFCGQLEIDSPALKGALRRHIDGSYLSRLIELYQLGWRRGGTEEVPVKRDFGVSFNPKPARICQILIQEVKESDPTVLGASLIISSKLSDELEQHFPQELLLAYGAQRFPLLQIAELPLRSKIERLALALRLDEARHLHMSSLSSDEIAARVNLFQDITNNIEHEANKRLIHLLQAAIERLAGLLSEQGKI